MNGTLSAPDYLKRAAALVEEALDQLRPAFSAVECDPGIPPHLAAQLGLLPGRDVGEIGDDGVEGSLERGEEIAQRLEQDARAKAGEFMNKAEAELEREVGSARQELRAQVVTMALAAAEKVVKENLDDAKHRQLVEDFIQQLGDVRA